MKTTLYLIRHSIKMNCKRLKVIKSKNLKNAHENIRILSPLGEEKARILSKDSELHNLDELWASDMFRALETAKYIAIENDLPINIHEDLVELKFGTVSGITNEHIKNQFLDENIKKKNGESRKEGLARILPLINEILDNNKGKRVAVVCHAMIMNTLLLNWCELKYIDNKLHRTLVFNGKIIVDGKPTMPEVFKLEFNGRKIVNIENLNIKGLNNN